MSTINPTGEQLGLLRKSSKQGPFVMVNLLKFKSEGRRSGETGRSRTSATQGW